MQPNRPFLTIFEAYLCFPPSKIFYALFVRLILDTHLCDEQVANVIKRGHLQEFERLKILAFIFKCFVIPNFLINGTYFSYLPNYHLSSGRTIVLCPNIISFFDLNYTFSGNIRRSNDEKKFGTVTVCQ